MLKLHPESNLNQSVIILGSDLLRLLNKKHYVFVDDVIKIFLDGDKKRTTDSFFDVLTFLFFLGVIDYKGHKIKIK